jgi:predicted RNase H-like HicB family nuclease
MEFPKAEIKMGITESDDKVTSARLVQAYRVILETDEDGRVVATSPDIQGAVTDGKDEDEALRNAVEAIQAVLDSMNVDKDFILIPSHKSSV